MTAQRTHRLHVYRRLQMGLATTVALAALTAACQAPAPRATEPVTDTTPPALTWMVLNDINGVYFDRADPMNRPPLVTEVPEGMIRQVNVSPDGQPDWLIDYSSQDSQWCGTGGCLMTLYVSDGEDYVMALNAQVVDMAIADQAGQPVLDLTVHHLNCKQEVAECHYSYSWDAGQKTLVAHDTAAVAATHAGGFNLMGWQAEDDATK